MKTCYEISEYKHFDKSQKGTFNRRLINGHITNCTKCLGYCQFQQHSGFLTAKLIEKHKCISKECYYFLPKIKETESLTVLGEALIKALGGIVI